MHHARHIISIILVTLAVVLTATTGRAQTFTGSIAGTVKDSGDLVLPGVTVTYHQCQDRPGADRRVRLGR